MQTLHLFLHWLLLVNTVNTHPCTGRKLEVVLEFGGGFHRERALFADPGERAGPDSSHGFLLVPAHPPYQQADRP